MFIFNICIQNTDNRNKKKPGKTITCLNHTMKILVLHFIFRDLFLYHGNQEPRLAIDPNLIQNISLNQLWGLLQCPVLKHFYLYCLLGRVSYPSAAIARVWFFGPRMPWVLNRLCQSALGFAGIPSDAAASDLVIFEGIHCSTSTLRKLLLSLVVIRGPGFLPKQAHRKQSAHRMCKMEKKLRPIRSFAVLAQVPSDHWLLQCLLTVDACSCSGLFQSQGTWGCAWFRVNT